jgi:hypothetical protein
MDEMIIAMVQQGKGYRAIKAVAGDGYRVAVHTGTAMGQTDGAPVVVEHYRTMNHGTQQRFQRGADVSTRYTDSAGVTWEVIATNDVVGSAHMPSASWWVAKKVEV